MVFYTIHKNKSKESLTREEIQENVEKRHKKIIDIILKLEQKGKYFNRKNINNQLRKRRIYVSDSTVGRHIRLYKYEKEQARWEMTNM